MPASEPRHPDVVGIARHGVVYTGGMSKIAEHGGGDPQDRHVPILVVLPGLAHGQTVTAPVETAPGAVARPAAASPDWACPRSAPARFPGTGREHVPGAEHGLPRDAGQARRKPEPDPQAGVPGLGGVQAPLQAGVHWAGEHRPEQLAAKFLEELALLGLDPAHVGNPVRSPAPRATSARDRKFTPAAADAMNAPVCALSWTPNSMLISGGGSSIARSLLTRLRA